MAAYELVTLSRMAINIKREITTFVQIFERSATSMRVFVVVVSRLLMVN